MADFYEELNQGIGKKLDELAKDWTADQKDAAARYKAITEAWCRFCSTLELARTSETKYGPGIKKRSEKDGTELHFAGAPELDALGSQLMTELKPMMAYSSFFYDKYGVYLTAVVVATNLLVVETNQRLEVYLIRCGSREAYARYKRNWPNVKGDPKEVLDWTRRWNGQLIHTVRSPDIKQLQSEYARWEADYWTKLEQAMWSDIFRPLDSFEQGCRKIIEKYAADQMPKGETLYQAFLKHMCGH